MTLSSAKCNYDIYDHELLTVIHTLNHWHHYLQGTSHPVTLLTDHKNLMYFCQLQKLSQQQAHWMMFLQDFNLQFVHIPGTTAFAMFVNDLNVILDANHQDKI